jgi:signal transduction histidine kinase
MTSRLADTRRPASQSCGRGTIVALAAITISAVLALAALGGADRSISDERVVAQAFAGALGTAQAIFDRDRQLLTRMTDAEAAGLSNASALPDLPSDLRGVALFDPAGVALAIASTGLDERTLASLGEAVARGVASHPAAATVVIPDLGGSGTALAALAQPWIGANGFSGGIAVVAFDRAHLAVLDRLTAGRTEMVTADGMALFAPRTEAAATGDRLETIRGTPLLLRYRLPLGNPATMLRATTPFAVISLIALGAVLGLAVLVVRRDRTAHREIESREAVERQLRNELRVTAAAATQTDEVNQTRSRFLAQVTHELRTPLNAILGFSETIRLQMFGPVSNSRYLEYAGLIHDAGAHLLSLINDLLDNARIEAGRMEIAPIRVSAAAVGRSALDLVELLAAERKLTLTAAGVETCPDLNIDPRAMKQVLVNLLSNAIKYTPSGGRIEMRFTSRSGGGVAIEVADTGTGMSAEDVLYAFEPFGRSGSERTRRQPGTGLGLSLARSLVRLHGGDLTLASRLDAGTTATITLPASAAFGAAGATVPPAKNEARNAAARAA